jgi:integrase
MPFSEAAEGYLTERQREATTAMKNQTEGQERAVFRLFADYCGDKAIGEVSPQDATGFLERVATLDPLWGRSPATKERSLEELLAKFGRERGGLSGRTLNRYSRSLAKVWKWGKRRGETSGDNPFADLTYREAKTSETGYIPFSPDQLNRLFAVSPASVTRDYAHELHWVPRIGLYSGMRLNEICSLSAEDVKEENGIWYFDIPAAKSEAGVRLVPIHSKLVELGLPAMVPTVGSLFPRLKGGGPDNKLGWYASRSFTRLRRKAGATAVSPRTGSDRLSFHSLRKNVVRCLERARVPQNEAAEIIGHEKAGITYRVYNPDGLTLEQRQEIIENVEYPGLMLPPWRPLDSSGSKT